jgi:hypothetical protein
MLSKEGGYVDGQGTESYQHKEARSCERLGHTTPDAEPEEGECVRLYTP